MKMLSKHASAAAAVVLAGSMLLTLSSCGGVSKSKVDKNPAEEVENAVSTSIKEVIDKDSPAAIVNSALKSDKAHLKVTADGVDIEYWLDSGAPGFVAKINIDENDAALYFNDSGVAVESKAFLGDTSYGIGFKKIGKNLENSEIWSLADVDYEEIYEEYGDEIDAAVELLENLGKIIKDDNKSMEDAKKEAYKIFADAEHETTSDTFELHDGEVDAVVLEYELESDTIKDFFDIIIDGIEDTRMMSLIDDITGNVNLGGYKSACDMIAETFNGAELTIALNKKNGQFVYAEFYVKDSDFRAIADLGKDPANSEDYIFSMETGGTKTEIIYSRSDDDDSFERALTLKEDDSEISSIYFELSKEDGAFVIRVNSEDVEMGQIIGTMKYTDKSVDIVIDELLGEKSDITISADTTEGLPKVPKYTDILTMSEDELEELADIVKDIESSIPSILYGM